MELFDLEIPIRNTGTSAVLAEWRNMEQTATSSNAKVTASFERASRAVERQLVVFRRGASGIDAIAQRTNVLTQGLQHASTQAQSLVRLRAAETQLQTALARGNASLFERIRLENELVRVRTSLTAATQRQATAEVAPVGIRGRLGAAGASAKASVGTLAAGFAGFAAVSAVLETLRSVSEWASQTAVASDELESALRKLKATARLTGAPLKDLQGLALQARDNFGLAEVAAVDLTAQVTKLAQRAGDSSRAGEAMAAWLDLAAANGLSVDEALQGLTTTLAGQDEGLNRINLQNPMQIWKAWGDEVGKTVAQMSEQDKWMAILVEVTRQGAKVQGEYAASLDTAAGAAQRSALEMRAFQATLGGIMEPIRKFRSELAAKFWQENREDVQDLISDMKRIGGAFKAASAAAGDWKLALGAAIASWKQSGLEKMFEGVTSGSSTTATPPEEVDPEAAFDLLVRSLELGTATTAMRREATAAIRTHLQAARDESRSLEDRNAHAEKAKALQEAMVRDTKAGNDAIRERTAALIALLALEGPQVPRWQALIDRSKELQASLDRGNLSYAERVRVLTELAAIEEATFPSTLPPDRMKPDRGLDIRRDLTPPLDTSDPTLRTPTTRGGEGSIFGRLAKQIEADGKTALEAADAVEEQLRQAGESLAATFEMAVVGAFASIGAGGSIGEALTGILGTMLGALGEMAIQFGLKSIAIASLMETIMNALASLGPIGAIAAGAALVALGSALKGAASSSFGGGGGRASVPRNDSFVRINAVGATPQQAVAAASGLSPQQVTVNQTIIGTRDPQAVRAVGEMAAQAVKRGIR